MGRIPCCQKDNVKRGQWTPEEDHKLSSYIAQHGTRNWRLIPKHAGLQRCGKSCRLRWTNYLRPDLKHGQFTEAEEQTIVMLHSIIGNRWSVIAAQLPGRTDNDVKNHWNTKLKKKLSGMGIDPVTHKPFSHLISEIANTLAPPQVPHLAEAALGCFKDEMLHLLTKKRIGVQFQMQHHLGITSNTNGSSSSAHVKNEDKDKSFEKINYGVSKDIIKNAEKTKSWDQIGCSKLDGCCSSFSTYNSGFNYSMPSLGYEVDESPWNQSMCAESSTAGDNNGQRLDRKLDEDGNGEDLEEMRESSNVFNQDCVLLWDLPSEDLMNPIV